MRLRAKLSEGKSSFIGHTRPNRLTKARPTVSRYCTGVRQGFLETQKGKTAIGELKGQKSGGKKKDIQQGVNFWGQPLRSRRTPRRRGLREREISGKGREMRKISERKGTRDCIAERTKWQRAKNIGWGMPVLQAGNRSLHDR